MKFRRFKLANEITRREGNYDVLAKKLGYTRGHIAKIVTCRSDGSLEFWDNLQNLWNIADTEFKSYMEKTEVK